MREASGDCRRDARCGGHLPDEKDKGRKERQRQCDGHARKQQFGGFSHVSPTGTDTSCRSAQSAVIASEFFTQVPRFAVQCFPTGERLKPSDLCGDSLIRCCRDCARGSPDGAYFVATMERTTAAAPESESLPTSRKKTVRSIIRFDK